ncbi:MAG: glycosyltransferase family A protein [Gammaproteobacteria bacterium]|nr:glycosyltransferase family A protein [Gammaproteobacteria bacterium]
MKRGTLSVVVCNYNHAHYLPAALQAILDQSYRPLEVIVIDDGSTDNSVEVIEGLARKDPIVHLYRNEQNQGVWFSANRGLSLATGEYIYFAAADDRVCSGFFGKSMGLLAQYPQAGLCSALLQLIGVDGEDKGWVKSPVISPTACFLPPEKVLATLTRYGFWFTGHTVICRRDAILRETGGFIPELYHYADHLVDMVVALKCGACFIPEVLATWRVLDAGYAETHFNNAELSRATFEKTTQLMRSPKYAALFPEKFVKVWEERGWYGFEMRHYRRLIQNQLDFISRLRGLRPNSTLLDKASFAVLKLLTLTGGLVGKAYLWHRRINWDFPWVVRMRRSYSRHAPRTPAHRK